MADPTGKEGDRGSTDASTQNLSQPSATEQLTSSIEEGKQYAGVDVKKMIGDALSADGREQKDRADAAEAQVKILTGELSTFTNQITGLTTQVSELTRLQNDAEADKIKDDAPALASLRARQANQTEKIRLDGVDSGLKAREVTANTRDADITKRETSVNIKLAAMAAGVDEKTLADLVPDGDPGRLVRAANIIKQGGTPEIDPITGKPKVAPATPTGLTQTPASVISAGGDSKSVSEAMLEKAKGKK